MAKILFKGIWKIIILMLYFKIAVSKRELTADEIRDVEDKVETAQNSFVDFKSIYETFNERSRRDTVGYTKSALDVNSCEKVIPNSCQEATAASQKSDLHILENKSCSIEEFWARCIYDKDGSWLSILRRYDGSMDFNRNWTDYAEGFGNLDREFFIGLEMLHKLLTCNEHELRIIFTYFGGSQQEANYYRFLIGNATKKYELTIGGYKGNFGDILQFHNGLKFSTKDQHNDGSTKIKDGGWWHTIGLDCYVLSLTEKYNKNMIEKRGLSWNVEDWYKEGLKAVEMMIRPKKVSPLDC